jgi:integrase
LPKLALTDAVVKRLKLPASGAVDYFDRGYPSFALRVGYGGAKTWVFLYRVGGRLKRMTLGRYPAMSLAEAREAWRSARNDIALGHDPAKVMNRNVPTTVFAEVVDDWFKRDQGKNRTVASVRRAIDRDVLAAWAHRQVADLGRRDVLDLIDGIVDRGSPTMARRVHAFLHRFFNWCVGRGIIDVNPMANLPKPGREISRERVLTDDELTSIWRASNALGFPFGPAIRMLLLTGARRSEVGGLRWKEISGDIIKLEGSRTKSGAPHTIPLSAPAVAIVQQLPRLAGSDFVFTVNGLKPAFGWANAKSRLDKSASIAPWRIHDLRRTVATGLQKLGVGLQVVESILGHVGGSRAGVVVIYQRHTYDAEKRAALEAWGAHVMALLDGPS